MEKTTAEKEGRKCSNQDTQDAVIRCDRLRNSVDGVHAKADDNRRQVTAEHGRKHGTQAVQEEWYPKENSKLGGNDIQEQAHKHQQEDVPRPREKALNGRPYRF